MEKISSLKQKQIKAETSPSTVTMTLEQATEHLKKLGEWWAIRNCNRDTVIKWASYLKEHGITK